MQQWQYVQMLVDLKSNYWADTTGERGALEAWHLTGIQPKLDSIWFTPNPRMNELGTEGWELNGVLPGDSYGTHYTLFFKRPSQG